MATIPTITTIQKTECIGNSLVTINTNYDNIRNSIASVNTDLTTINSTLNALTTFANSISSAQLAKGWVKFSGRLNTSGNLALITSNRQILNSYNVTTVYREEAGVYLVSLATPINAEFIVNGTVMPYYSGVGPFQGTDLAVINLDENEPFPSPAGEKCRVIVRNLLGTPIDPSLICLTFFSN